MTVVTAKLWNSQTRWEISRVELIAIVAKDASCWDYDWWSSSSDCLGSVSEQLSLQLLALNDLVDFLVAIKNTPHQLKTLSLYGLFFVDPFKWTAIHLSDSLQCLDIKDCYFDLVDLYPVLVYCNNLNSLRLVNKRRYRKEWQTADYYKLFDTQCYNRYLRLTSIEIVVSNDQLTTEVAKYIYSYHFNSLKKFYCWSDEGTVDLKELSLFKKNVKKNFKKRRELFFKNLRKKYLQCLR